MDHLRLTVWLILVGVGAAFLVAVFLGPRLRARFSPPPDTETVTAAGDAADDELSGGSAKDDRGLGSLVTPIITLTVLLLSFTLVQTWTSFRDAIDRVGREARTVDYLADATGTLTDPQATKLRGAAICYARAVADEEWPALSDWPDVAVPSVDRWTDELETGLAALAASKTAANPFAREIITADRERALFRGQRLAEVKASIPIEITLFLLAATMLAIIGLGVVYLEDDARVLQVGFLAVLSILFAGVLLIVTGLDTPYSGVIALEPTDISRVAQRESASFAEDLPGVPLPCDDQGRPIAG